MSNIKLINASGQSTVYENIDTLKMTDEDNHYVFFGISYTQYNISYNLATESHSSSSDTTVNSNGTYTTTISYDSGYTKDSITVTMGGTDISSTAVSGDVITVENPTGDISITVTTKEQTGYTITITCGGAAAFGSGGYSLDNGSTWTYCSAGVTPATMVVTGVTQIKFITGGETTCSIKSTTLGLSLSKSGGTLVSDNIIITQDVDDVTLGGNF